jgi:hypothetical protein
LGRALAAALIAFAAGYAGARALAGALAHDLPGLATRFGGHLEALLIITGGSLVWALAAILALLALRSKLPAQVLRLRPV